MTTQMPKASNTIQPEYGHPDRWQRPFDCFPEISYIWVFLDQRAPSDPFDARTSYIQAVAALHPFPPLTAAAR
jgi:hypothetical protein